MMEKLSGLRDGQVNVVRLTVVLLTDTVIYQSSKANLTSSRPIVIDLLDDTPRPTPRLLQCYTKRDINAEIVLSDDSDYAIGLKERRARKPPKRRPSPTSTNRSDRLDSQGVGTSNAKDSIRTTRNATKPKTLIDVDPIEFSSPVEPAFPSRVRAHKASALFDNDFEDLAVPSDLTNPLQQRVNPGIQLSGRTAALLAALKGTSSHWQSENSGPCHTNKTDMGTCAPLPKKRKETECESHASLAEILATPPKKTRKKGNPTSSEKQERAKEKELARLAREANKRTEKENRQKLKELRAWEKEVASELASANRLKIDKRISTPEMIVDLPRSLEESPLGIQIQSFLKSIQVEVAFTGSCPIPNIISWRRKASTRYNEDLGHWEPIQEQIRGEKHVMCLVPANDFVEMAQARPSDPAGMDIDTHVLRLKSKFEGRSLIYLIEGLGAWMRKNKSVRNRAFQAAVLQRGDGNIDQNDSQGNGTRRRKPAQQYVDADMIEDALLRLQVVHKCLIHHTAMAVETAEWVSNFTQHISTIPYRSQRMDLETSFCMESGQVKTGKDKNDTYIRLLQEIVRVTGPVAYGIAAAYPDVPSLVNGFKGRGPTALQELKKTANKDGAFTNNNIGPAISKRVYKIFTGTDPASNEV
ncbi:hypothetical protein FGG08_004239 [Glutinoglossum americanum]|uniref:ERCC4 domain-containing protein n=1 Tax=Glutinoglossum americanum TaxID=1670608 RepID=A0A9P8HWV0_9PEZI|nr:hypothetical protein FGG08_004239 [Glutinoglossum americanum]